MTRRGNRGKVQPRLFHRSHRAWKSRNGRGIPTFPQPRRRRAPFTLEDQPAKLAGPARLLRRAFIFGGSSNVSTPRLDTTRRSFLSQLGGAAALNGLYYLARLFGDVAS